jgi:hypothetical protein
MATAEKNTRAPREVEARAHSERPQSWKPASVLPEPDRQPGYEYRFIRVSSQGKSDPSNVSSKLREGWEPVPKEEQPRLQMLADPKSSFENAIEIGGLLLCKIPTDFMQQRKKFYANKNKAQIESVDNNFMRQNNPVMPLFSEKKSTVGFGKGK